MSERRRSIAALATEFVVIVVGVLVALGFDELRESRREARIEAALIDGLINDLVADSIDIAGFRATGDARKRQGEFLLAVANGDAATPEEVGAAFGRLIFPVKLDIVESTYRDMVGSGASQSLSSSRARLEIGRYYGLASKRQNGNSTFEESQRRLRDVLIVRGVSPRGGEIPAAIARDPEVAAAVSEATFWAEQMVTYPADLAAENESLLSLLRTGDWASPF